MVQGIQEGKFPDDANLKVSSVTDLLIRAMFKSRCRRTYSVRFSLVRIRAQR